MKHRISIWPAALLALFVAGCKQPTDPAFSPDGQTLVFEENGKLILRSSEGDRTISMDVEGSVCWAPDGSKFAFSRNGGTTIYDFATGRAVGSSKYAFPYAWQGGMLTGVKAFGDHPEATIYRVSPDSAEPHLEVTVPFHPDRIDPIENGDSLLWVGPKAYWFDGLQPAQLPQLYGYSLTPPQRIDYGWLLAKAYAAPHTHRQLVGLALWTGDPAGKLEPVDRIDVGASTGLGEHIVLVQDLKISAPTGRMVATILTLQGRPSDEQSLASMVDRYDLLNNLDKEPAMPKKDSDRLDQLVKRLSLTRIVFAGVKGGKWVEMDRAVEPPLKKSNEKTLQLRIPRKLQTGMTADGTRIAITNDEGTKTYPFPNG
ncbi:MAG TPA: hypothetical protein VHE55_03740 [Fimbriimonadaceae bacterium]|nr:hypothetical protein [Fimbriimonadaceae bacterium]